MAVRSDQRVNFIIVTFIFHRIVDEIFDEITFSVNGSQERLRVTSAVFFSAAVDGNV